jgi:TonB family protein
MAKREKFGKFVLLEDIETSSLGVEDRAAKLGPTGIEKIVSILRLRPALSANAEIAKNLMDQVKVAAQLQNPNVIRIYGIGKVEAVYYVSYEFIEGKSLGAIFERCRRDTFPFSVDHALLIASKVCSALEYSHGRKTEGGRRYYHGLLNTGNVLVSYEGEIRVRGFGHWLAGVRDAGGLRDQDALYLSPEQAAGGMGDTRSDIFGVGALLFEALTGRPLFEGGREGDTTGRLAAARLQNPSGDDDSVPKPIADILARSLAQDPSGRYAEIQELRKAIDTLLFSGDFSPTTFNLAFFMHSIFRDDIDRESKQIKEEREASYADFLTDGAPKSTGNTITLNTTPIPASGAATQPRVEPPATVVREAPAPTREIHAARVPPPPTAESAAPASGVSAKEAAASFTFHKETVPKGKTPIVAASVLTLAAVGSAVYYFLAGGLTGATAPAAPPPTTLSSEAVSALARVKELEDQLRAIEEEKAAAEQKAKDEAAAKVQKEAKAKGTEVDPATMQKAQEEAAKKARADQERKAQEEKKKREDAKAAEEQRQAEEQRKAEDAARVATASATTTLPPTPPSARAGALVNVNDPGVIGPVPEKAPPVQYPQIALRQRVEGTVELNVLVDENGAVTDAQIVSGAGGRSGLDEAALENVKKRRYRPATKDGVAVKTWIPVRVQFKLPS